MTNKEEDIERLIAENNRLEALYRKTYEEFENTRQEKVGIIIKSDESIVSEEESLWYENKLTGLNRKEEQLDKELYSISVKQRENNDLLREYI